MKRRRFSLAAAASLFGLQNGAIAQGADKIGVLMLHGKNPGSAQDPNFRSVLFRLEREGMVASMPDMPWSRLRYIDGNWDQAMQEVQKHVVALRDKGAKKIVLMGHSMGCPAALSYASRKQDVNALVLFAPGHIPRGYYEFAQLAEVRKSIDLARSLVQASKGDTRERFTDINQGRPLQLTMTANDFLSYFDPNSDADMGVTAAKMPAQIPVMTVIGTADPLFSLARSYFHDKLPPNPRTQFLEVTANHISTPEVAKEQAISWIRETLQ